MTEKSNLVFLVYVLLAVIAVIGGYFIYQATYWSPWAFSDSAAYLSAARNFDSGNGLGIINSNGSITRMTEFAPLYPVILSILTGTDGNLIQTSRWIDIISFTASIYLVGLLVFSATHDFLSAIIASVFMVFSPVMVDAFSGLMSEPLFILLMCMQIYLLWKYLNSPSTGYFFLLLIVTFLLPLTRYAGIVLVVSAGFLIILFDKSKSRRRFFKGLGFTIFGLLPIGLWFLDLYLVLDKVGGKRFTLDFSIIRSFFESLSSEYLVMRTWFPYFGVYDNSTINLIIEVFFSVLMALTLIFGVILVLRNRTSLQKQHRLFALAFTLFVFYLAFIAFTHSITIPQIDIINRMLAPTIPLLLLAISSVFSFRQQKILQPAVYLPLLLLLIFSARFYFLITTSKVNEYHAYGFGFNSREVQESDFLAELKKIDLNKPMISNSAAFVLFHTNRFPVNISQFHNRQYGSAEGYGEKTFRERHAPLIIHLPDFYNTYGADSEQLLTTITKGLEVSYSDPVGAIYYYP